MAWAWFGLAWFVTLAAIGIVHTRLAAGRTDTERLRAEVADLRARLDRLED